MTAMEAIDVFDVLIQNPFTLSDKLRWLSELDQTLLTEIVEPRLDPGPLPNLPYVPARPDEPLLAPPPYDAMYPRYLEAQCHYYTGELQRYNNAMAAFNPLCAAFERWYIRTHPAPKRARRFRS